MSTLPPMSFSFDRALRRFDALTRLGPLPRLPERWRVAFVALLLVGFAVVPRSRAALPDRVVYVPGAGWVDAAQTPGVPASARDGDRLSLAVVGAPVGAARGGPEEPMVAEPAHAAALGRKVSLNSANLAELESLPGVGPTLAARIVAARPFRTVAELDRVRGVGAKSLARLAPLVEP